MIAYNGTTSTDLTGTMWASASTANFDVDRLAGLETFAERKARLLFEHKLECQQAFRRPSKRSGRGQPPPKKWGPRKR